MCARLDTCHRYETPEGIELELILAGPLVRGLAWGIDFSIRAVAYILFLFLLSLLGGVGLGLLLIGMFLVEWFYPVFFEMRSGMTPGKRIFGLRVIHVDTTPLSWSASLVRNLLRAADFLPFLYAAGFFSMLMNQRFQRLGDLAAGTIVVYTAPEEERDVRLPRATARPLPWPLRLDEQRLILQFAGRWDQLSEQRRSELAALLAEFTGKSAPPEELLLAHANWLARGR